MKIFSFIILLCLYCNIAKADCDDGPGPCWITTLSVVGGTVGGALNAGSIGFNIYNTAKPEPMSKLSKGFTYGTLAVGSLTLATGVSLFALNNSRADSTNIYNGLVVGTGVATIGSGIMSLVVDKNQKNRSLSSISIVPIVNQDKQHGSVYGALLTKAF